MLSLPLAGQAVLASLQPPTLLKVEGTFLGDKRLYPSPVFQDTNKDGILDIVIGDLSGIITISLGQSTQDGITFGKDSPLKGADGKFLKFHNW